MALKSLGLLLHDTPLPVTQPCHSVAQLPGTCHWRGPSGAVGKHAEHTAVAGAVASGRGPFKGDPGGGAGVHGSVARILGWGHACWALPGRCSL